MNIAIYPGSFNPFHKGHLSVHEKAKSIFDRVIIAVGQNPQKQYGDIDRVETLKKQLGEKIEVEKYEGFLIDYICELREKHGEEHNYIIIRGIRNAEDANFEIIQLRILEDQNPFVKVVFIPSAREYSHISSSAIRMMESIQKGSASEYIAKKL